MHARPHQCWKELCKWIQHCCATLKAITEQKKCWEFLAQKFDQFQTLYDDSQHHAAGCANGHNM